MIAVEEVVRDYGVRRYVHADLIYVTGVQTATLQIWHQRGMLAILGVHAPGRGRGGRRYCIGHLLAVTHINRLAQMSIPLRSAVDAATMWLPCPDGSPSAAAVDALRAGASAEACTGRLWCITYIDPSGHWRTQAVAGEHLAAERPSALLGDTGTVIVDAGRLAHAVLTRIALLQGRRKKITDTSRKRTN